MSDKMSYHGPNFHYNVWDKLAPFLPASHLFTLMKFSGITTITYYDDYKLAPKEDYYDSGGWTLPLWKFQIDSSQHGIPPVIFYIRVGDDRDKHTNILLNMRDEFDKQLKLLRNAFHEYISDLNSPLDKIINRIEVMNQIIDDMKDYNGRLLWLVQDAHENNNFLKYFKITKDELHNFNFPSYNAPQLEAELNNLIEKSFDDIIATYKRTKTESNILRHDNSTTGDGRHISPGIVNITDIIAVNLTCDVIDGSYSASDNSSTA